MNVAKIMDCDWTEFLKTYSIIDIMKNKCFELCKVCIV